MCGTELVEQAVWCPRSAVPVWDQQPAWVSREGQGAAGRRWCWLSLGCAQSPDGFAGSVVLQLQQRTCPSTHRAGISVAGRFWAKAVQKKWLFVTQLMHCLGSTGAVGREVCDSTLQLPFCELTWKLGIYTVPSSRRKGTKRLKTPKLRKRGCSPCSSVKILFGADPLWRRVVIEGLALFSLALFSKQKLFAFSTTWEAQGAAASMSTLAEPRAGSWLLPQSCVAITDNKWVLWCCWEWKEWAPDRQLCVVGNDSHRSGSAFVSGCWNVLLVGLGDKSRFQGLMRMLSVSSSAVSLDTWELAKQSVCDQSTDEIFCIICTALIWVLPCLPQDNCNSWQGTHWRD